jgi:ATP-binding cassette subfamily B protein
MPRQYDKGGRAAAGLFRRPPGAAPPGVRSLRERVGDLKKLRPFMAMVWRASPGLTAASLVPRLIRELVPAKLFVGKRFSN